MQFRMFSLRHARWREALRRSAEGRCSARLAVEVAPHFQPGYCDPWTGDGLAWALVRWMQNAGSGRPAHPAGDPPHLPDGVGWSGLGLCASHGWMRPHYCTIVIRA
jgi:hypothetical protein